MKNYLFPIKSINSLSKILNVNRETIEEIASKSGSFYAPFNKSTKSGKIREIDNPYGPLKEIQNRIQKNILSRIKIPERIYGGVKGKSPKANAEKHVAKPLVVTIDIKNFFPSISNNRVYKIFSETLGCSPPVSRLLTQLTTFQRRLPQGAPTSTIISALALIPLHNKLFLTAVETFKCEFTIWVDDITISGKQARDTVESTIQAILDENFSIRNKKKKIMPSHKKQICTGILVNNNISLEKAKIEKIRKEIIESKKSLDINIKSTSGKISYAKYINHKKGEKLEKLFNRTFTTNVGK